MSLMRALLLLALVLAAQVGFAPAARAATSCSIVSAPDLNFGAVDGATQQDMASAKLTVRCTHSGLLAGNRTNVRACVRIGAGVPGWDGAPPARKMLNSYGDALKFQLYQDPNRTTVWDNVAYTFDLTYANGALGGGSGSREFTLYGRLPAQGGLASGLHTNFFGGAETRLDFRYQETNGNNFPNSCAGGGDGGGSLNFPFSVIADAPAVCTIDAASDLDFGSVPGLIAGNVDQTSAIALTCSRRTAWQVGLDNGQNFAGGTRRMRNAAAYLSYELHRNPARSQRWSDTLDTDTVSGTGTGAAQALTVYGRVPPQAAAAGNYSDVVTVTVTY